ncbi:MAG TPA: GNAT family protein [Coriobacteriia bacterium]|nr:GNAT family protein [Coriobacteriia bacterium]
MTHTAGHHSQREVVDLKGDRVLLRPLHAGESASLAAKIAHDPEASPWWGDDSAKVQRWLDDEESSVFVIDVEGEAAGVIQYEEENDPDYRFAGVDIALLSPWIGKGYGFDALRTLARYLFEVRGHHRLHIDPAVANRRAIAAYERVGFRPVGTMRRYERAPDGTWRDSLLMDLLAEELAAGE